MLFKDWLINEENSENSKFDILKLYFQQNKTIKEISEETGNSIGNIYRTIHNFSGPNRTKINHHAVFSLADSGFNYNTISDLSGYTLRHIRNILKK
jgi:uncharacterized protein YvpB